MKPGTGGCSLEHPPETRALQAGLVLVLLLAPAAIGLGGLLAGAPPLVVAALQLAAALGAGWAWWRTARRPAAPTPAERRAGEVAEARHRADLLATAAHEIRTPLSGVIGLLDLVLAAPLPRGTRADAAAARRAADDLALLLRDLIEVPAGIAAPPEVAAFRIDEVMDQVVGLLRPRAEAGGNRLATAVATGTPAGWLGDAARIRQILTNLVANALRFTEGGEVRIEARETAAGALELRVSDTGTGIAPDRLPRLFERFGRSEGGTGLGLSISRDLAMRMGGDIVVRSAPGLGTVFTVTLPLPQTPVEEATAMPPPPAAPTPAGLPVLIVDDVPVNRRLMGVMLERAGFAHEQAGDAATALGLAATRAYAAVLMDLEMPGTDGLEATRRLRALPPPAGALPVIAVTAHGGTAMRDATRAAGMDGYLIKPVTPDDLAEAIARAARHRQGQSAPP